MLRALLFYWADVFKLSQSPPQFFPANHQQTSQGILIPRFHDHTDDHPSQAHLFPQ